MNPNLPPYHGAPHRPIVVAQPSSDIGDLIKIVVIVLLAGVAIWLGYDNSSKGAALADAKMRLSKIEENFKKAAAEAENAVKAKDKVMQEQQKVLAENQKIAQSEEQLAKKEEESAKARQQLAAQHEQVSGERSALAAKVTQLEAKVAQVTKERDAAQRSLAGFQQVAPPWVQENAKRAAAAVGAPAP